MTPTAALTQRQQQIVDFVRERKGAHGTRERAGQ